MPRFAGFIFTALAEIEAMSPRRLDLTFSP
jgi:hypothetical protein